MTACRMHAHAHTTHAIRTNARRGINLRKSLTKPAHICERTSACSEPYLHFFYRLAAHAYAPADMWWLHEEDPKSDMQMCEGIVQHGRQLYLMS